MNEVNKTLYIPLYAKSYVTKKGLFIDDRVAVEIWDAEGFPLRGKASSKWLAYYLGIRAAVYDRWLDEKLCDMPSAAVIHIGCGLDSRVIRACHSGGLWYDVDFPDVIEERRKYYTESEGYFMLGVDASEDGWCNKIESDEVIVIMEGVSMYLSPSKLKGLIGQLDGRFKKIALLMDAYSSLAARMSKKGNPIKTVGVTEVFGLDEPRSVEAGGIRFLGERDMTPERYICELTGIERRIFKGLYAGGFSKKLYRLYEFKKEV